MTKGENRYAEAIRAFRNIGDLDKSLAEIAGMFGYTDQRLRLYLKRHHPKVLEERNRLRAILRQNEPTRCKITSNTLAQYAPAVDMLQNSYLTIEEVAEEVGLNAADLEAHVIGLHRKLVKGRPRERKKTLNQRRKTPPKADVYAEAVALYRTTDRTEADIAAACGVRYDRFHTFLNRWCRDAIADRKRRCHENKKKGRVSGQ